MMSDFLLNLGHFRCYDKRLQVLFKSSVLLDSPYIVFKIET